MTDTMPGATTDELVERLFSSTVGALELLSVYLGVRLGLYEAMTAGAATSDELAERAGIHPRYAREWLEQQAVAGFVSATGDDAASRRFTLPAPYHPPLTGVEDPSFVAPFALLVAGIGEVLPALVDAYRTGGGVPFADYGADLRDGQAAINRPAFLTELGAVWIPAMPDVHARLNGEAPSCVANIGCGAGWASIGIARAYPRVQVYGFDPDGASIEDARRNAAAAGVEDRVNFFASGIGAADAPDGYDLVCILEALHDMTHPVEVLAEVRAELAEDGAVLVADERVAETFTAPGDEIERMMYGWSVLHCLPAAMTESDSAMTGTVMRPQTLSRYAEDAGFAQVEVLDVDNDFFRLYRLR